MNLNIPRKQKYRAQCHKLFDKLWRLSGGGMTRPQAYAWLAKQMNIPVEECHFSLFDLEQLIKAKRIVSQRLAKRKKRRSLTLRRRASLCNLGTEEYKKETSSSDFDFDKEKSK